MWNPQDDRNKNLTTFDLKAGVVQGVCYNMQTAQFKFQPLGNTRWSCSTFFQNIELWSLYDVVCYKNKDT